ncbi:hypothetical protein [Amycolatopsis magusensis]|uniref:hypothetical protein n=1 Tax=Amycolatopsis magusensis TaxID=882444 RepID=UPI0024A7C76A|nr:hypothetical protein [Amycolatopsis magusensis]
MPVGAEPSTSDRAGEKIVASLLLPRRTGRVEPLIPLPVADLGPLAVGSSVAFGLVRVGGNRVVAARVALERLGWAAGLALRWSVSSGMVVVTPSDRPAAVCVPTKMSLTLPSRLRSRCRIRAGDQILLAAVLERGLLAVYPQHVLHAMVIAYHDILSDSLDRTVDEV